MHVERVVIELEEVGLLVDLDTAEVVFMVRVVVTIEVVEGLNGQQ